MVVYTFPTVNRNKFHDELIANGINPIEVSAIDGTVMGCDIRFVDGTDMVLVQQIVDAHDSTPLPPQPTELDYLLDLDFRLSMIELGGM